MIVGDEETRSSRTKFVSPREGLATIAGCLLLLVGCSLLYGSYPKAADRSSLDGRNGSEAKRVRGEIERDPRGPS